MTFFLTSIFVLLVFWRPQEWLFPWLFGFPLLPIIYVLALFSLLVEFHERRIRFPRNPLPQYFLLAGLFFAALMSHASWFYLAGLLWTIEPVLRLTVFAMLVMTALDRPSRLRKIAWIIVLMAALMAVHCLLQQQRGYGFANAPPLLVGATRFQPAHLRSQFFGIFEDPNDTAQMLAMAIPFTFVLFRRRNFFSLLVGAGFTCLLVFGFMTTHSRGGLVAMIAVGAFMVALVLPERFIPWVLGALAIAGLMATPLSAYWLRAATYTYERVDFWAQCNWAFRAKPVFGIGYGMIGDVIAGRAAHNAFVSAYTELGLFGYWFWFNLILLGLIGAWRTRIALKHVRDPDSVYVKRFAGSALAAMVAFSASSYFLSRAFIFPLFILMGILAPLPGIAEQYLSRNAPPLLHVRRDLFVWGTLGTILSVLYVYYSIILVNRVYFG